MKQQVLEVFLCLICGLVVNNTLKIGSSTNITSLIMVSPRLIAISSLYNNPITTLRFSSSPKNISHSEIIYSSGVMGTPYSLISTVMMSHEFFSSHGTAITTIPHNFTSYDTEHTSVTSSANFKTDTFKLRFSSFFLLPTDSVIVPRSIFSFVFLKPSVFNITSSTHLLPTVIGTITPFPSTSAFSTPEPATSIPFSIGFLPTTDKITPLPSTFAVSTSEYSSSITLPITTKQPTPKLSTVKLTTTIELTEHPSTNEPEPTTKPTTVTPTTDGSKAIIAVCVAIIVILFLSNVVLGFFLWKKNSKLKEVTKNMAQLASNEHPLSATNGSNIALMLNRQPDVSTAPIYDDVKVDNRTADHSGQNYQTLNINDQQPCQTYQTLDVASRNVTMETALPGNYQALQDVVPPACYEKLNKGLQYDQEDWEA